MKLGILLKDGVLVIWDLSFTPQCFWISEAEEKRLVIIARREKNKNKRKTSDRIQRAD